MGHSAYALRMTVTQATTRRSKPWTPVAVAFSVLALVLTAGAGPAYAGEIPVQGVNSGQVSIDCTPNGPGTHFASSWFETTDGLVDHVIVNGDPACDGTTVFNLWSSCSFGGAQAIFVVVMPGATVDLSDIATLDALGMRRFKIGCFYMSWGTGIVPCPVGPLTNLRAGPGALFGDAGCGLPTSKDQCKNLGWKTVIDPVSSVPFKNQGTCVSYVATHVSHR